MKFSSDIPLWTYRCKTFYSIWRDCQWRHVGAHNLNSPRNCRSHSVVSFSFVTSEFRKSSESDIASEDKENRMSWQRSKSMDVLSDDRDCDVFMQQVGTAVSRCCRCIASYTNVLWASQWPNAKTYVTSGCQCLENLYQFKHSQRSNAKTYVTSGCQCLENLFQFKHVQSVYGATFVRKLCWKYSDKTKYEAIKSEVNKQELFYRYSTFKASLSRNCFIF